LFIALIAAYFAATENANLADEGSEPQDSMLHRIRLRSPHRVLLVVVLAALLVATQGRLLTPIGRAVCLSTELLGLRCEDQRLAEENRQLAEVAAYLKTEDGQELAARSELGAVKEGERLIICRPTPSPAPPVPARLSQFVHLNLTRGYRIVHNAVSYLVDLGTCLLGTSELSPATPANDSAPANVEP